MSKHLLKLGSKLKKLRLNKGWTLERLAKEASSSKSYMWEIENGHTTPSCILLSRLASSLHTTQDFLLDDTRITMEVLDEELAFLTRYQSLTSRQQSQIKAIIEIL
jgi:transcriptional regulator with XRE-family HTH domain